MKKQEFINIMKNLEKEYAKLKKLQKWVAEDKMEAVWNVFELNLEILSIVFEDVDNWITWFVYDCDFGKDKDIAQVTSNWKNVELTDSGIFYDFLKKTG
jgi:hypothetical protein